LMLVIEVLIKLTVRTVIFVGTRPEVYLAFHMMKTWSLPGRERFKLIFPENELFPLSLRVYHVLNELFVFLGNFSQCPIKGAGPALIIAFTRFFCNYPRLHPQTGGEVGFGTMF